MTKLGLELDRSSAGLKAALASELEAARRRTLELLGPVPTEDLVRQHSPLMSPLVWDLAHIGWYEEYWLLRRVGGGAPTDSLYDDVYDAFRHPRAERPALPLLSPERARSYVAGVRRRALETLERIELDPADPLLADGFVYGLVVQHEQQHVETMLATLQLRDGEYPVAAQPPAGAVRQAEALVDGGPFVMGTDSEPWAYDNERPAHEVDLPAFWIDTVPVTNRAYLDFVETGGYRKRRYWDEEGFAHRREAGLEHPLFWRREGDGSWSRVRFGRREELPLDEPVQHVCWYEADAYARWAGKRLPSEVEWEKASSWDPATGRKRRYPWGDDASPGLANLGGHHLQPAPAGAYPAGSGPWGCRQMAGDVWEWTASDFLPYPGFSAFPYREYSEVFFGSGYRVLRGGSFATHPTVARTTSQPGPSDPPADLRRLPLREGRVTEPALRSGASGAVRVDVHVGPDDLDAALRADVLAGLGRTPKELPPKWFYDDLGCALFDAITRLPEYYLTRREREVLYSEAATVARLTGADTLVELGSGSGEKTVLLLDALAGRGALRRFVPFDVSESAVRGLAQAVASRYPGIEVHGLAADFEVHLPLLPDGGRRLVAFLGSTIGNLRPPKRAAFLAELARALEPDDHLLLGADLVKDAARLEAAYDDAVGVTSAFNLNVLNILNRELGADFEPRLFEHVARFDPANEWVEMRLRSRSGQRVRIERLDLAVAFAAGEEMRTEISAKFRREGLIAELGAAGLEVAHFWTDARGDFALVLARPA